MRSRALNNRVNRNETNRIKYFRKLRPRQHCDYTTPTIMSLPFCCCTLHARYAVVQKCANNPARKSYRNCKTLDQANCSQAGRLALQQSAQQRLTIPMRWTSVRALRVTATCTKAKTTATTTKNTINAIITETNASRQASKQSSKVA